MPPWVVTESDDCLRSVAEEAYTAKALALTYGADQHDACRQTLQSAEKQLGRLSNTSLGVEARTRAGTKAERKFWEAKVCARSKR